MQILRTNLPGLSRSNYREYLAVNEFHVAEHHSITEHKPNLNFLAFRNRFETRVRTLNLLAHRIFGGTDVWNTSYFVNDHLLTPTTPSGGASPGGEAGQGSGGQAGAGGGAAPTQQQINQQLLAAIERLNRQLGSNDPADQQNGDQNGERNVGHPSEDENQSTVPSVLRTAPAVPLELPALQVESQQKRRILNEQDDRSKTTLGSRAIDRKAVPNYFARPVKQTSGEFSRAGTWARRNQSLRDRSGRASKKRARNIASTLIDTPANTDLSEDAMRQMNLSQLSLSQIHQLNTNASRLPQLLRQQDSVYDTDLSGGFQDDPSNPFHPNRYKNNADFYRAFPTGSQNPFKRARVMSQLREIAANELVYEREQEEQQRTQKRVDAQHNRSNLSSVRQKPIAFNPHFLPHAGRDLTRGGTVRYNYQPSNLGGLNQLRPEQSLAASVELPENYDKFIS